MNYIRDPIPRIPPPPSSPTPAWILGPMKGTAILGLYVHGLERTLGYYVLSVDHGHRRRKTCTFFFQIKRSERCTISDITYQLFSQEHFFVLSLLLFFWRWACHPVPFSFDFNSLVIFQVHAALKGDLIVRETSNDGHLGRRSIFRGRSFAWTRIAAKQNENDASQEFAHGSGCGSKENRIFGYNVLSCISSNHGTDFIVMAIHDKKK